MLLVLTEHISVKNSMPGAGLEPIKAFCSDLGSGLKPLMAGIVSGLIATTKRMGCERHFRKTCACA